MLQYVLAWSKAVTHNLSRRAQQAALLISGADLIIQSSTPEAIMETAKSFLADQTKQGSKGKKTRPQEALAKVHLPCWHNLV